MYICILCSSFRSFLWAWYLRSFFSLRLKTRAPNAGTLLYLAALAMGLSLGGAPCFAQDPFPDPGMKLFGSFDGSDIDSFNLVNLQLNVHIPLVAYPQRGNKLHFGFSVRYIPIPYVIACSHEVCVPMLGYSSPGTAAAGVVASPDFDLQLSQVITSYITVGGTTFPWYDYEIVTPNGAAHPLGEIGGTFQDGFYTDVIWIATDASGYHMDPAHNIIDRSGIRQLWDPTHINTSFIEDSNGNQIAYQYNTGGYNLTGWQDTMGRTVPVPPTTKVAVDGQTISVVPGTNPATTDFSHCAGPLPISSAYLWTVPTVSGATVNYKFCFVNVYVRTAALAGPNQFSGYLAQLQNIVLPDNTAWTFQYENADPSNPNSLGYGFLTQITQPTGATISYSGWDQNLRTWGIFGGPIQRTANANDGTGGHTWTYSYTANSAFNTTQTTVLDPLGNESDHFFWTNYPQYETQTNYYQGSASNGTLLKSVNTDYSSTPGCPHYIQAGVMNVVPIRTTTTWPNGRVTKIEHDYDSGIAMTDQGAGYTAIYGNAIAEREYDYGSGGPGPLLRSKTLSYIAFSNSAYLNNNLLDRLSQITTTNGAGTTQAVTQYGYDGSSLAYSGISLQHDSSPPSGSARGNQTSISHWLNGSTVSTANCPVSISNGYLTTNISYFDTGTVQQRTDPCGDSSSYLYSSAYYGAYLTRVTNALNQSTSYAYDLNTGLLTSMTDPNMQPTTNSYDIMGRLTGIAYPDGGTTSFCYTDLGGATCGQSGPPYEAVTTKAITASVSETSTVKYDGLGRVAQTQLNSDPDPGGVTYVETTYDGVGRIATVTNPHRTAASTTDGTTQYAYDALSRVVAVTKQDGSTASTNYGAFPCTTATDEAGNARKSCVDGLGRLTGVWEDPSGLDYETDYQYNVLGDLVKVTQNGSNQTNARTRNFNYDSLSRLTSASNPESGTTAYTYDADGNLITKTTPLPNQPTGTGTVTAKYGYDTLNRLTGKTYTGMTMPSILFGYDAIAPAGCSAPSLTDSYPVGRRTSMCDGSGAISWSHDKMGRVLSQEATQATSGSTSVTKGASYGYNLDGSLNSLTYPSGNVVTYTVGGAGGVTQLSDPNNNYVGYAGNSATYTPSGALASMTNAHTSTFPGIVTSNIYNDRLQPLFLSAGVGQNSIFGLCYDFHLGVAISSGPCSFSASNTGDNGNVFQVTNVNRVDATKNVAFTYDSLDRISQANTTTTGTNCWGEIYNIDAWGNLTNISGPQNMTGCNSEGLNAPVSSNNQMIGWCYDGAGNLLDMGACAPQAHSYVYDAEGHLQSPPAVGVGNSLLAYTYYYDGDGNRVQKCNANPCASGSTSGTLYWIGSQGEVLDESSRTGSMQEEYVYFNGQRVARRDVATNKVYYYFSNHLGSASIITDSSGNIEQQTDYYPYGRIAYASGADANHYKFIGKERDSESNLDNFGKRFYASSIGRWMSPDLVNLTEDRLLSSSSTLNKYAYAADNPLKFIDPDGQDVTYFYDQGGTAGHAILFAYNQATGDSAVESFGPAHHHLPIDKGVSMFEMSTFTSADILRQDLTALTIQTTPELAQQVIDYIKANPDPALWIAPGPNCSTQVWKILRKFKLASTGRFGGGPGQLPRNVWKALIHQYNPRWQRVTPQNGQDYGDPRYDMFNLLWQWLSRPQEVVTHRIYWEDIDMQQAGRGNGAPNIYPTNTYVDPFGW